MIAAAGLTEGAIRLLASQGALVVEDIDREIASEAVLFHLMNLARENGHSLLLTSRLAAGDLAVALPDLRSRLRAALMVEIAAPDDSLLAAVLVKHFADRQLAVDPQVIAHLVARMERTTAAAAAVAGVIDRLALATRRKVSRTLASKALELLAAGEASRAPCPARSAAASAITANAENLLSDHSTKSTSGTGAGCFGSSPD
jgi:chromosomal replication initiation ATPase DnaA